MNDFLEDVWTGLNTSPKYLQSKYFYDETGDEIFREIMACEEYYLTRCEMDIFSGQANTVSERILSRFREFDLVELGPGDCSKTIHLLRSLMEKKADFNYCPVDISDHVIMELTKNLPTALPGIQVRGLIGDYFKMLGALQDISARPKVVLFLGSNIGNVPFDQNAGFFKLLRSHLAPGDLILTGFDLVKDPETILAAYNDKGGVTRRFNLNLLRRMNTALDANFDLDEFEHSPVYDKESGACKSYLVSKKQQVVTFSGRGDVRFEQGERIFMEISQKYTVDMTDEIAGAAGFTPLEHFLDQKKWFLDALWQAEA